ncbi:hypothetical protein GGI00_003622, partial [Coemansia sp. RSA 2681]
VSAGYLFPAYRCFKLLRGGPEAIGAASGAGEQHQRDVVRGILKHWVVMAGFTAAELVIDTFMFWMPLVGLVKISFIAWLIMPGINGADIVYDHIVEPYLIQNEDKLDSCFRQAEAAAQRSSSSVSKTAYDKWVGYVQRAINQQSTSAPSPSRRTSEGNGQQQTGLAGLLQTVSQKMPQASAAATYLAGFSGVTEGPPTQADTVGKSSLGSMLTTWMTAFSSNALTQLDDDERLRDIRTRKSQLQDMVSQLETSERAIIAKTAPPPPPPVQHVEVVTSSAHVPKEFSGFEEDVVMVGESGMESSSETHHDSGATSVSEQSSAAASGVAKPPSTTSRRWFW